jgi:hypothetical protein
LLTDKLSDKLLEREPVVLALALVPMQLSLRHLPSTLQKSLWGVVQPRYGIRRHHGVRRSFWHCHNVSEGRHNVSARYHNVFAERHDVYNVLAGYRDAPCSALGTLA